MEQTIVLLPGDGIGPEIVGEAVRVLQACAEKYGHRFSFIEAPIGGAALDACGEPFPAQTEALCQKHGVVLLGAVGGPRWDAVAPEKRPEKGLLALRASMGLFANLRPIQLFPALAQATPLKPEIVKNRLDMLIMRELTGGIYFGERGTGGSGKEEYAFDTERYARYEIARISHRAFASARLRRRRVTLVDKANVLASSRLWRQVVAEVAAEYPDVEWEAMYVDNAAMQLIVNPGRFDVLLTSNLFGDILSDEAAVLTGSIGMLASASLGEGRKGVYEPAHGSAPDIAGQNRANPLATILSAALLLRHSLGLEQEAAAIEQAVAQVLAQGMRTEDIAQAGLSTIGTREMAEGVLQVFKIL